MKNKRKIVSILTVLAVVCCWFGSSDLFGGNKTPGTPDTDAMLIIGIGESYWTEDISFGPDEEYYLSTEYCSLYFIEQGKYIKRYSRTNGYYVFSNLKPGSYRIARIGVRYQIKSIKTDAVQPASNEYETFSYEFWETDFPELMVNLSQGQIEFMGVIHLKTKHRSTNFSETIRRGSNDSALYLDKEGEAYVVQKVFEEYKDGPWAPRLREKLREIVETKIGRAHV